MPFHVFPKLPHAEDEAKGIQLGRLEWSMMLVGLIVTVY